MDNQYCLVKKANIKWRIYIDYKDLNKAYPKESFPLSRIYQLLDATSSHKLLSFMDTFSGYNQIRIPPEDKQNTAFIIERSLYCYKMMSFDLKNIGAIYQHLVNKVFKQQIDRNIKIYVDDMLVRSTEKDRYIIELEKAFEELKKHQMKLNPNKYAFGVTSDKFLNFLINQRGIEANSEKIHALLKMKCSTTIKKIQQLTGRVAALSRFISRSAERYLPFFRILKQIKNFN